MTINMKLLLDSVYPVGSYYETSDTSFDPNKSWGGTWVEDTQGRVLVAQDSKTFKDVSSTGGEETHTLTINEMPSHFHEVTSNNYSISHGSSQAEAIVLGTVEYHTKAQLTNSVGGSQPHNNLQPYVVIKRWHRTA